MFQKSSMVQWHLLENLISQILYPPSCTNILEPANNLPLPYEAVGSFQLGYVSTVWPQLGQDAVKNCMWLLYVVAALKFCQCCRVL